MGRDLKRGRPIRFILNRSKATAANVYLMLYPKPILARAFERDPELVCKVWSCLNDIDMPALLGEGRVYGGGLYKMEPKELSNVPAEAIAALLPDESCQPRRAVQETLWPPDHIRVSSPP